MKCLGLHNKPRAEVHPGHMLTGPKEEEEYPIWSFLMYHQAESKLMSEKLTLLLR
jgi:hypothetical protein